MSHTLVDDHIEFNHKVIDVLHAALTNGGGMVKELNYCLRPVD
jgi:hypothetical protein